MSDVTLSDASPQVPVNVQRLIETRLLVQANSGAGKSWALRRILETTYGACQHVVIDVEGEFHTLREKYDYILAGKGGDCPADLKSAALLARRLLELGVSAIVDISELGVARERFVKLFLDSMISAPRDLWHPCLVVIDEAHIFCPESGKSESAAAVIDLMTRGRKRGFAGVLATQRISKLHKDAAAEANNKLIGRSSLDIDMKRAAAELGFTDKEQVRSLRSLPPGFFYAFGPALTAGPVVEVKIGAVKTHHPRAGQRGAAPTPPRERVRQVLAQLADLPAEADQEAKTVGELRARVKELEAANKKVSTFDHEEAAKRLEAINLVLRQRIKQMRIMVDEAKGNLERAFEMDRKLEEADEIHRPGSYKITAVTPSRITTATGKVVNGAQVEFTPGSPMGTIKLPEHRKINQSRGNGETVEMDRMERAFLTVLAQHTQDGGKYQRGMPKRKILVYTGYSAGGATSACFARIVAKEWAGALADGLGITTSGLEALGDYDPLPVGSALRDQVLASSKLSGMERKLLEAVCEAFPSPVPKRDLLQKTGYAAGGATSAAFAHLVALDYVESKGSGHLVAAEEFFDR